MTKLFRSSPILLILTTFLLAGNVRWEANYHGFLDNREYYNSVQTPKTYIGSDFMTTAFFQITPSHEIAFGLDYIYELGGRFDDHPLKTVMNYRYNREPFYFQVGVFPRRDLLHYPLALLTDTLDYFRPNIEGFYVNYSGKRISENFWLDWMSCQSEHTREIFMTGFSGNLTIGQFSLSHYTVVNHFALSSPSPADEHIRDNVAALLKIGWQNGNAGFLDTLQISSGVLMSADRSRHVSDWYSARGWYSEIMVSHGRFAFAGTFYLGERQKILFGDRFFGAKSYARTDLIVHVIRIPTVQTDCSLGLHFIEGKIDFSQTLTVRADFSR
ncbi:MAG: hypothetical protein PHW79_00780 [Candidatus Marinimicrobia bacterium]|nr:hypothetical protein [Candidatus Neomarinimicrobiota bacterium]